MSMDYPDYLRIRDKSRLLGLVWMMGDRGYYLGLVTAVLAFSGTVAILAVSGIVSLIGVRGEVERYWPLLPLCLIAMPIGIVVLLVSAWLKEIAHRRSGIHEEKRS